MNKDEYYDNIIIKNSIYNNLVLHEDEHLLILNKPAGVLSVLKNFSGKRTVMDLQKLIYNRNIDDIGGGGRYGAAHRLDDITSGVLLIAKNEHTFHQLRNMFNKKYIKKYYRAIVSPALKNPEFDIDVDVVDDKYNVHHSITTNQSSDTITKCIVIESFGSDFSYINCEIITGKHHQIRVHMKYINNPIVGDWHYGYKPISSKISFPGRVLLHSYCAIFEHPITENKIEVIAKLPIDFQHYLDTLRILYK